MPPPTSTKARARRPAVLALVLRGSDFRGDLQLISIHGLIHELLPCTAFVAQCITCGAPTSPADHFFAEDTDGNLLVVDEWPDEESWQRFFAGQEDIKKVMAAAGATTEPTVTAIASSTRPIASRPGLITCGVSVCRRL